MNRRELFKKTAGGITGAVASHLALSSCTNEKPEKEVETPMGSATDFETLRRDFPPLMKYKAYLDTAFVGLMSKQIKTAHEDFLEERLQFGPIPPDKSILGVWMDKTEMVRAKLASFLGAKDKEVAFTYCTGCGSNIALNGIDWREGDNAVIDDLEYSTDFHILNSLRTQGVEMRIARSENGTVPPEKFEALVDERTRALCVTHVSHLNGFRHDLPKLAEIIHAHGGYLIVDSAQAVGGVKVDVKKEGVDFLSGIPYKWLNGPNGVGFLYVREEIIPSFPPDRLGWSSTNEFVSLETMESAPLPDHAKRFQYGTLSYEGIYALDAALDYINRIGIEVIEKRNLRLTELLRERLSEKGKEFHTPEGNRAPILSFFADKEKELAKALREKGVYVTGRGGKEGHMRVSPHFYNNEEDIDVFVRTLSDVAG